MIIDNSIVYDIETYPNAFTLHMECLNSDMSATWQISQFKDDRRLLMEWFNWLNQTQTAMIGFNNLHFDYPIIHYIFNNPNASVDQIYQKAQSIISSKYGDNSHMIWANNRFAPQIDLMKIHHFDNNAKSTSLKALEINMRSDNVIDLPIAPCTVLTQEQLENVLIPYNRFDVDQTKRFAHFSMGAMQFRKSLIGQFGVDALNWSDTKIGTEMMESKIGKEICYDHSTGRKIKRQSPRSKIALAEIIFPYIRFDNPEFQRILDYLKNQTLRSQDVGIGADGIPKVQTKGVFTSLTANVGGLDFHFGTGGIHGSLSSQKIEATDTYRIRDIDVEGLYPTVAIVNQLHPEHLGVIFVQKYAELPAERKKWQAEKGKKCVEANSVKLAGNSVYGNSNNPYSVFYDPKFTLTITINGQLMLCMLAEKLATVPTLKLIQINTDGITYYIHKDYEPQAVAICQEWERQTALVLEDADYNRMWIRDVNNYVAEDIDGRLKKKGAYWSPDPLNYHESISQAQPPAWYKDLSNVISIRAAVAYMTDGVDPETFIRLSTNPFDFMCRVKTRKVDRLLHGGIEQQRTTRYYVSTDGRELMKEAKPNGVEGAFKKANGVTQATYDRIMIESGGQWDERIHTKNKSVYETVHRKIQAGHKVTICNNVQDFDFTTVNYDWYINEAKKIIIV